MSVCPEGPLTEETGKENQGLKDTQGFESLLLQLSDLKKLPSKSDWFSLYVQVSIEFLTHVRIVVESIARTDPLP